MAGKKHSPLSSRIRSIVKGWTHPTQKQAERLDQLINAKLASETGAKEIESIFTVNAKTIEDFLGAVAKSFQHLSTQQQYVRTRLQSRVAVKYALDALGLSPIYDREKREAVHSAIDRYFPTMVVKYNANSGLWETQLDREIGSILGGIPSVAFAKLFVEKMKVLTKKPKK